jgi:hypothetical protein
MDNIVIEVVKGGFILTYPVTTTVEGKEKTDYQREVFVSPRKLHQKLKEVIDSISLVGEDKE